MHKHRAGEVNSIPFRNERHFCANGFWYFEARGGVQMGPFKSKEEMEGELIMFIRAQNMTNQSFGTG